MTKPSTRLLIISDLHAMVGSSNNIDTKLYFENDRSDFADGLVEFIKNLRRDIDILVCSGDISNKASKTGFEAGWGFVNRLGAELSIPEIFSVPGNHDHQSRKKEMVFDPKHHLQFVIPPFPFSSFEKNTKFWAWHWCHTELDQFDINVISINSSAYHGYGDEYEHGRIAFEVSDQIGDYINDANFKKRTFNILLCHHHPERMEYVDVNYDKEAMEGGQYLLNKISRINKGPWLIIHGHKHFADIAYARSPSASGPVIFSAGSLSAYIYQQLQDRTANQFYILEVYHDKTSDFDRVAGVFEAFSWTMGEGWHPSTSAYLPARGGFGSSVSPSQVVKMVRNSLKGNISFLNENDIEKLLPELKFFTPHDLKKVVERIEESGLSVLFKNYKIIQIGKPI